LDAGFFEPACELGFPLEAGLFDALEVGLLDALDAGLLDAFEEGFAAAEGGLDEGLAYMITPVNSGSDGTR
jgi:hypothetical protein